MRVDIYIRERSGNREIRVPWLPESIDFESGGTIFAEYDIMNRGTVAVPTGAELGEWSWESVFPGEYRTDTSMLRGSWNAPSYYHNILEDWRKNRTPLHLLVVGYPINADVYLSDYTAKATGGFGDMEYSVKFLEERQILVTSTNVEETTKSTSRVTPETTSYTVKKGDTLWDIARKYMGSGTKWESIYNANKGIIESTAKKYGKSSSNKGWWIYPGTVLHIEK